MARLADQSTVNEYMPGQGIAAHVDCVPCFGDTVVSLSLGAPCVMDFVRLGDGLKISRVLEPRSLLALTGDARYGWRHSIAARRADVIAGRKVQRGRRVSLTFRIVIRVDPRTRR